MIRSTNAAARGGRRDVGGHDGHARRRAELRRSRRASTPTSTRSCSTPPTRASRSSAPTAASSASTCAARSTRRRPARAPLRYGTGRDRSAPDDLTDCQRLLNGIPSAIAPINAGLNDDPVPVAVVQPRATRPATCSAARRTTARSRSPARRPGSRASAATAASPGYDVAQPSTRYHNYYDATPEVNFHGDDPKEWLAIYDPLQASKEARSFYVPVPGRPACRRAARSSGMEHVWRTDDNGGDRRRSSRRTATRCTATPARAATGSRWATRSPTARPTTAAATTSSRSSGRRTDNGTLWAATRVGRAVGDQGRRRRATRSNVHFYRIDTAATPGRFVSGIAIDPADPNHAWISYSGYGAYTPGTPQHVIEARFDPKTHTAHVHRPLLRHRRPAGDRASR